MITSFKMNDNWLNSKVRYTNNDFNKVIIKTCPNLLLEKLNKAIIEASKPYLEAIEKLSQVRKEIIEKKEMQAREITGNSERCTTLDAHKYNKVSYHILLNKDRSFQFINKNNINGKFDISFAAEALDNFLGSLKLYSEMITLPEYLKEGIGDHNKMSHLKTISKDIDAHLEGYFTEHCLISTQEYNATTKPIATVDLQTGLFTILSDIENTGHSIESQ